MPMGSVILKMSLTLVAEIEKCTLQPGLGTENEGNKVKF